MNATPKFIAWFWDGTDCWAPQIIDAAALAALRERAQEATGGNIEVHAYPLHAFDAMREALEQAIARIEVANQEGNPIMSAWLPDAKAALALAKGE